MTKKENIDWLYRLKSFIKICMPTNWIKPLDVSLDVAIKSLKRESSCEKCPTKYELEVNLKKWADAYRRGLEDGRREIVTCKYCKHWKDSDGVFRRGINAESKCPINTQDVFEGNFYCKYGERE